MVKKRVSSKRKHIDNKRKGLDKLNDAFDESLLPDVSTPKDFFAFIQNSTSLLGSESDLISNLIFAA